MTANTLTITAFKREVQRYRQISLNVTLPEILTRSIDLGIGRICHLISHCYFSIPADVRTSAACGRRRSLTL